MPTSLPDAEVLARIERLEFEARQIVEGTLAGRHRSPRHGFAVEFAQHREYVPGDDIKFIDWKVFGRTDRYHLKQFEQETNLSAWLIVDVSESMLVQSGARSKQEAANVLAAALAFLILQQTDAVGLATLSDGIQHLLTPASHSGQIREIIRQLLLSAPPGPGRIPHALHQLAPRLGRRAVLFVLSDFLDPAEEILAALHHLRYFKHEVVFFQVLDAAELDFPFRHPTLFRGLEHLPDVLTDPLSVREHYLGQLRQHLETLEQGCRLRETDLVRLRTDADLGQELSAYLQRRRAR